MEDEDSQIGKEINLRFTSNGTADNIRDNDCGSAKRSDTVFDYESQNTNPWTAIESCETSLSNASSHNQIFQPTKFSPNQALPRAWQPPTPPTPPQGHVTEVDEPYPIPFEKPPLSNYFDPFDINPPTQAVRADVRDSSGFVSFPEKKKEAKKVCKQISRLLRDKSSRSRGSRMFQKRRKRADKFTIIGYGTQPAENGEKYLSDSEDSGSQASTGLDCGNPVFSTDDEIPAYDSCGLHNVLTEYDTLSPSEQILHNQLKNLAMDAGTMRGKGAKIFAKRQQRMEKFVITDENRRQNNNFLVENKQNEAFQEAVVPQRPPYIRPGSSIGIGPKKTIVRAQPNATKYNRNVSGYCTDFEDDSTSSRNQKPQINYFSDCETSVVTNKPRRTRPSNRRAWDPREETDSNNNYVDSAPASKEVIASYPTVATGMLQPLSGSSYADREDANPLPATATDNTRMFRSVRPPTLTVQTKSFVKPYVQEMVAKDQVFISRVGANTSSTGTTASGSSKTWSRVNFCPRKSSTARQSSAQVVQYPCNRQSIIVPVKPTWNLPPPPAKQKTQQAYQTYATPKITSVEVHPKPLQRPSDINPSPTVSRSQIVSQKEGRILKQEKPPVNCNLSPKKFVPSISNGNIGYKPKPAMVLLGQPMENISKPWKSRVDDFVPDRNNVEQLPPSEFIENVSRMENEEEESSPYADSNVQNVNEACDFVHSENGIKNNASHNDSTSSVESTEVLGGDQMDNYPVKEEDKAKVIKCCPQTFTSTLPSRCFSPPVRPNMPTQNMQQKFSPKFIKIATTNNLAEQYSPSKSTALHSGPVPTKIFNTSKVDSENMEEPGKQTAKVSACLKVLDPTKALFQPKQAPAPIQPSPTLCAVMQSENDVSYGSFKTPSISYQPLVEMSSKPPPPPPLPPVARLAYDQRPVRYQSIPVSPSSPKTNGSPAKASPQPLGIIADSMKGKGAKMFAKQQQRMQRYTKETSVEDFPGLQEARRNGQDDFAKTVKTSNEPRPMPGFAKNGKKIELGEDTKQGMMKVLGEFQKGKVKRPSDARKKKGRDPLYYQQYLSYRPPSAADFVEPTADSIESYSDSSSVASSMTNNSSLSSSLNQDSRKTFCPKPSSVEGNEFPSLMGHDDSTVSQIYQASPYAPPRVAPKPSRAVITRQLSKPTSPPPPPVVAVSPLPEIYAFKPSTATPSPKGDKTFVYPSLNGGTVAGQESNESYSAVTNGDLDDLSCYPYPLGGIAPPSYQEVSDDTVKYRSILKNGQRIEESTTPMDEIDINHNMKATISKPLYNSEGNGVSVKIIIPQ